MSQTPYDPSSVPATDDPVYPMSANLYQTPPPPPAPDYDTAQPTHAAPQAAYAAPQAAYAAPQAAYQPQAFYGTPMPGYPAAPAGSDAANQAKGFFARLFDLSFKSYVTPSVVRFLFVVAIVLSAITWIGLIITAFSANVGLGILAILLGWIIPLLLIILYRMGMEISVAIINIAEHTARIR